MHRLVVALVALLGLAGVAIVGAYLFLFSAGTDRAAPLAPANSAFYANIYLQPSAGQQMNLSQLIGRLPGFADEASLDDKVDQIVENLLSGTGIDYRTQVKPWLGDQIAVAGWPAADDPTQVTTVVIAAVKDPEAAETAAAELAGPAGTSTTTETYQGIELHIADGGTYAFVGDMLTIGSTTDAVHAVVDVNAGADSLASRPDFREAMDRVPSDHLASAFLDLAGIASATGVEDQVSGFSTLSAALVAEHDGFRLSGSAPRAASSSASASADPGASDPGTLVEWMPEDAIAEVTVFGLRGILEDAEAAISANPDAGDVGSTLDTVRALVAFGLGLDLDADILPLLDGETALALNGLAGDLPSVQLLLRPSDPASAGKIDTLADRLSGLGADSSTDEHDGVTITTISVPELGDVAYAMTDGVVILALTSADVVAALDAHDGASLKASETFERTFGVAGTRGGSELFVNVAALVDLAGDGIDLPADARDILGQIGGLGLTMPSSANAIDFHAVLTIDESASPE
jgi:hypothetical protein